MSGTHVGVDAASGLVHSVLGTAANVSDVSQAHALLHGREEDAFGDAGYAGIDKRDEMQGKSVKWHVATKRILSAQSVEVHEIDG